MSMLRALILDVPAPALSAAAEFFTYSDLPGLEPSAMVMRRDPGDVIKVGDPFHVWYTKGSVFHGYDATIWYATLNAARGGAGK